MIVSENPTWDAELLDRKRQAFLTHQLNSAPAGKLTRTQANNRIPQQIQEELALTPSAANNLRTILAAKGLLSELKVRRSVSYTITDAGRVWIRENQAYIPLSPARGKANVATDVTVQAWQVAYLLLQLADAPNGGQIPTELNKRLGPGKLMLDAPTARFVRGELAVRGFIAVTRNSRSEKYSLTPAGKSFLGLCDGALTSLLRAANDGPASIHEPVSKSISEHTSSPTTNELEMAVMEVFGALRRERYANTGLVPIHEVRAIIRQRYGEGSASHGVLDEVIKGMRRSRKLGLLSISDRSRATEEQLRDAIVGIGETFFYLEMVDESASG
jgi:predicted transcriptional regulator